ncbi:hypothetical protein [Streptomyces sp. NPDC046985]|uniref:hypothetical protein n=1 Tax=Streptomyces sp. NPDC046985 TaxID=3155377 RepID=UPI0033ED3E76
MRIQPPLRPRTAALAAAVALGCAAGPAAAASGISVSANGSTVSVTTSTCTLVNGGWGTASLLASGQTDFNQGRQVALVGSASRQTAAWQSVQPGTYTVVVLCSNSINAGSQSIAVTGASRQTAPATSVPVGPSGVPSRVPPGVPSRVPPGVPSRVPPGVPSRTPSGGVMGGLGGGFKDYGTLTLAVGGTLVGAALIATGWVLRRRSRPYRL